MGDVMSGVDRHAIERHAGDLAAAVAETIWRAEDLQPYDRSAHPGTMALLILPVHGGAHGHQAS